METSLMSESVVDAADVEETVTQVLTHFVQGGDEQTAMSPYSREFSFFFFSFFFLGKTSYPR